MLALGSVSPDKCLKLVSTALENDLGAITSNLLPLWASNFCSVYEPEIQIHDYLCMLQRCTRCSAGQLLLTAALVRRLNFKRPGILHSRSLHRIVLSSFVLAHKSTEDKPFRNRDYARLGGVSCRELNHLESTLCQLLDWRLHVSVEELEDQLQSFCTMMPKVCMKQDAPSSCS
jgi:hypothetical protein